MPNQTPRTSHTPGPRPEMKTYGNPNGIQYRIERTQEGNFRVSRQLSRTNHWETAFAETAATRKTAEKWIRCHLQEVSK